MLAVGAGGSDWVSGSALRHASTGGLISPGPTKIGNTYCHIVNKMLRHNHDVIIIIPIYMDDWVK